MTSLSKQDLEWSSKGPEINVDYPLEEGNTDCSRQKRRSFTKRQVASLD